MCLCCHRISVACQVRLTGKMRPLALAVKHPLHIRMRSFCVRRHRLTQAANTRRGMSAGKTDDTQPPQRTHGTCRCRAAAAAAFAWPLPSDVVGPATSLRMSAVVCRICVRLPAGTSAGAAMRSHVLLAAALCCVTASAPAQHAAPRTIQLDLATAVAPVDRFYDLSVGSDFPGTLIRSDAGASAACRAGVGVSLHPLPRCLP